MLITQDEEGITIDFGGFSASGSVVDGDLMATGKLPGGEDLDIQLQFDGEAFSGSLSISGGGGCAEQRSAIVSRRGDDADFSGYWGFDLTVVGSGGCPDIVDYEDCFQIIQSGRDLLVVDEELGNLTGRVTGSVARIDRDNANERTTMIFFLDEAGDRVTGCAVRIKPDPECRSDLDFVGLTRSEPCASASN